MKKAIVTGITGQDGAYLAQFLLNKNYEVHGTYRRNSTNNFWRINYLSVLNHPNLKLHEFDLTDFSSIIRLIEKIQPDEIYNLAAQSFVGVSFEQPIATSQITGLGVVNILEAIRLTNRDIKFYQASTSEMFGKVQSVPQTETTNFYPRSPYGVAKLFAHWTTINYRESYDIFASSGILFNHESPIRGLEFVTRKISDNVSKIKLGKIKSFELGNLDAKRDWGYAGDYVEGMWKMMQIDKPDNFILATNVSYSVRDFVKMAFKSVDIEIEFENAGLDEVGINKSNKEVVLKINPRFYRPAEVENLIGDPEKATRILDWKPKTSLTELCDMMVQADLKRNII